ncbi:AraC family transcriptional regulator [Sphingobacterium sp. SGG-5]|uniref:helix-turn-helix transcriptional regulator n=1 Tax=Sphingobacterium sp. SGG-5 TaxID=2710881 RepID=UPI0013EC3F13|nr:AraC family transcriptional regulator [Sphingobacterium sp. SGG-5]NGM62297.1 AraC family transcriptional regulator [Sphingobacterium sp. SGG-5]
MEKEYVDKYYMTEVDAYPDSIYCHHALMGDGYIVEHAHVKGQFLYTEGGVVYLKTSSKSYFLPARHYIWIPSGVRHSIHPSSPHVIMRNLYFPRFETDTDFFDKVNIYPVNNLLIELIMFTNRWNGNIFPSEEPNYTIAKAFKQILPELSQSELPLALPYTEHPKLSAITRFLEQHVAESVNLNILSKKFELSQRTVARLFQKEFNMSFIQYYTILRMLTALKLLLDEQLNVHDVALRVGYSSLPTFSNTFQKIIGIRPSDYVKKQNTLL